MSGVESSNVTLQFWTDDDYGFSTTASFSGFTVDNKTPVHISGPTWNANPTSGSSSISLSASYTDLTTLTYWWSYRLNGAAYAADQSGASPKALSTALLDGDDYFTSVRVKAIDAVGNDPGYTENTAVYVKPLPPGTPMVTEAETTTAGITVVETEPGLGIIYAIYENNTGKWLQADRTLGAVPAKLTKAQWDADITATGLTPGTRYSFGVQAINPSDGTKGAGVNALSDWSPPAVFTTRSDGFSVHSFTGESCAFPDTGQTADYTATYGEDSDYAPGRGRPYYMIYEPVVGAFVTADNRTGLMWVTDPNAAGIGGTYTWENAISACENLSSAGYTDWRLPNIRELMSIVDYGRQNPSANSAYFQNTQSSLYWSATTYVPAISYALSITFSNGGIVSNSKNSLYYVRCVRRGP